MDHRSITKNKVKLRAFDHILQVSRIIFILSFTFIPRGPRNCSLYVTVCKKYDARLAIAELICINDFNLELILFIFNSFKNDGDSYAVDDEER